MLVRWSPSSSRMALTPAAWRPIARTSFSSKRSAWPRSVTSMISRFPSVTWAQPSTSPFSRLVAIKPDGRTEANSLMATRLILPLRVTSTQKLASSKPGTGSAAVTRSPLVMARMLASGMPLSARPASGIW
jgi:hypothetical protein